MVIQSIKEQNLKLEAQENIIKAAKSPEAIAALSQDVENLTEERFIPTTIYG